MMPSASSLLVVAFGLDFEEIFYLFCLCYNIGAKVAITPTSRPRTTRKPGPTTKPSKPSICDLKFDSIFLNGMYHQYYPIFDILFRPL